ncbi:MAG: hypothetical protein IJG80_04235 [Selenomonadaceae bacterium]|nr:hypothetical protein [Selenomonadaceae bacterium]MBQ3727666.1 hypothetical protein [Selenomonadaceae bacterium]
MLMILAGYKPFLFEDVFARVKAFTPKQFDVCILSSGLFDETLNKIAAENSWSYLSTAQNNIPFVQNLAIMLHEQAELIFKMDEDIFITAGVFDTLLKTAIRVQNYEHYNVGFVAPLIPINGYGHVRLLEKLGLLETYEKMFEKVFYTSTFKRMLCNNPDVAKFFWGKGGIVPSIDELNDAFRNQKISYSICSVRFSIGFILFRRELWKRMDGWQLPPENSFGPGFDEEQICKFCVNFSLAMVVAENAVVGHLSFGQQNEAMKEYYLTHREVFRCPK